MLTKRLALAVVLRSEMPELTGATETEAGWEPRRNMVTSGPALLTFDQPRHVMQLSTSTQNSEEGERSSTIWIFSLFKVLFWAVSEAPYTDDMHSL